MIPNTFETLSRRQFFGVGAATALTPMAFKGLIGGAEAAVQPPPVGLASRSADTPTVEELGRIARHY